MNIVKEMSKMFPNTPDGRRYFVMWMIDELDHKGWQKLLHDPRTRIFYCVDGWGVSAIRIMPHSGKCIDIDFYSTDNGQNKRCDIMVGWLNGWIKRSWGIKNYKEVIHCIQDCINAGTWAEFTR